MEEEQNFVQKAEAQEVEAENKLAAASNQNQEIQVQVKDTEKMLRATEGLVILSFLSPVFPSRIVRPCVLRTDKQEACRSTCDPMNTCNLAMKKEQFAIKYLPCFWC